MNDPSSDDERPDDAPDEEAFEEAEEPRDPPEGSFAAASADVDDEDHDYDDEGAEGPGLKKSIAAQGTTLEAVLESLIFVSDKPVTDRQLAKAARSRTADVRAALEKLREFYSTRGVHLVEVGGGFQFRSAVSSAVFVRDFVARKPVKLTRAQVETLAIVAYRQPVTRPEVDDIRGVDSGAALKVLSDRNLIKILGRKDEPGRPLLYGTTPQFLEFFGMASLRDLPTLQEFSELNEESRGIFERRMGEPLDLKSIDQAAKAAEEGAQADLFDESDDADADAQGPENVDAEATGDEDSEASDEDAPTASSAQTDSNDDDSDDDDSDGDDSDDDDSNDDDSDDDDSDDDDSDDDDSDDDDSDDDDSDDDDSDDDDSDDDDSDDDDSDDDDSDDDASRDSTSEDEDEDDEEDDDDDWDDEDDEDDD
ncbi:MAG: SMC-Scp complex subunit ScpB [Sandaracinus sp.]|nr:SMC-Scp complex subunit ScpB [Sandaracinus sp.]